MTAAIRGRSRCVDRDVAEPPSRADGRGSLTEVQVGPVTEWGRVGGFYGLRAGRLRPGGAIVPMRIDGRFGLETTHAEGTEPRPRNRPGGLRTAANRRGPRILRGPEALAVPITAATRPKGLRHARDVDLAQVRLTRNAQGGSREARHTTCVGGTGLVFRGTASRSTRPATRRAAVTDTKPERSAEDHRIRLVPRPTGSDGSNRQMGGGAAPGRGYEAPAGCLRLRYVTAVASFLGRPPGSVASGVGSRPVRVRRAWAWNCNSRPRGRLRRSRC